MNPFASLKICIAAFSLSAISVFAAPNFSMIGYATVRDDSCATTTGGAGGAARTISTLADLQTWAAGREKNTTPEIVTISGQLSSGTSVVVTIKHGANITILGAQGEDMKNIGLNIVDYKNVIIQYVKIHEVDYPDDALTIDSSHHIWVD